MNNTPVNQTASIPPVPIIANSRTIGEVKGDVFKKSICGSRHLFRRPPSIGLSVRSLRTASNLGAVIVQVRDSETHKKYFAPISLIWREGFRRQFGNFEEQIFLPLEFWADHRPSMDPISEQLPLLGLA